MKKILAALSVALVVVVQSNFAMEPNSALVTKKSRTHKSNSLVLKDYSGCFPKEKAIVYAKTEKGDGSKLLFYRAILGKHRAISLGMQLLDYSPVGIMPCVIGASNVKMQLRTLLPEEPQQINPAELIKAFSGFEQRLADKKNKQKNKQGFIVVTADDRLGLYRQSEEKDKVALQTTPTFERKCSSKLIANISEIKKTKYEEPFFFIKYQDESDKETKVVVAILETSKAAKRMVRSENEVPEIESITNFKTIPGAKKLKDVRSKAKPASIVVTNLKEKETKYTITRLDTDLLLKRDSSLVSGILRRFSKNN